MALGDDLLDKLSEGYQKPEDFASARVVALFASKKVNPLLICQFLIVLPAAQSSRGRQNMVLAKA